MFCYQIYQNVVSCKHFYNNIVKLSGHLQFLKQYLGQSIKNMGDFVEVHCDKPSYTPFCRTTKQHINVLTEMYEFVKEHDTDTFTLFDIGDVGNLLRIYYEFHSNKKI